MNDFGFIASWALFGVFVLLVLLAAICLGYAFVAWLEWGWQLWKNRRRK